MRILSIDPGTTESAWLDLMCGEVVAFGKEANELVREYLSTATLLARHTIVIEEVRCYGMPVGAEVFRTVRWIGRFEQVAEDRGLTVHLVGRQEVKTFWCKSSKAKDGNVRQALIDHYGAPGTVKAPGATHGISKDVWSALAIAGYWEQTHDS